MSTHEMILLVSMLLSSVSTAFLRRSGTFLAVCKAFDLASGLSFMVYGSPKAPNPLKREGNSEEGRKFLFDHGSIISCAVIS